MGLNLRAFICSTLPGLVANNLKFINTGFTHGYSNSTRRGGLYYLIIVCEKVTFKLMFEAQVRSSEFIV